MRRNGLTNGLLLVFALIGLYSCEPDERFTGVSAGARGLYVVTAYIVAGDTLFTLLPGPVGYTPGINKLGINNFTVETEPVDSDRLLIKTSYWRNNQRSTVSKEVIVRLSTASYTFSLIEANAVSDYEGYITRFSGIFYERTTGGGLLITPSGSASASTQDVIIRAQPAK